MIFPCPGSPRAPGLLNNYLVLRELPEVFADNSSCADRRPALGPECVFWPPGRAAGAPQPPEIPALPCGMIYLGELGPPRASGWGFWLCGQSHPPALDALACRKHVACNKNASRGLFASGCSISPRWALSTRVRAQPGAGIVPKFPSLSHQGLGLERLGGSQEASSPAGDLAQRCRGKAAAQGLCFRAIS